MIKPPAEDNRSLSSCKAVDSSFKIAGGDTVKDNKSNGHALSSRQKDESFIRDDVKTLLVVEDEGPPPGNFEIIHQIQN